MKEPESNATNQSADLHHKITTAVHAHRRKGKLLTGVAMAFGILAIVVSIGIVFCYFEFYRPKQQHIMANLGLSTTQHAAMSEPAAKPAATSNAGIELEGQTLLLLHVLSMATTIVAAAVAFLAVGTLVMLLLMALHRRVAFQQLEVSLEQISGQLKALGGTQGA